MAVVGEHHPAFEEYCECIFELDEDDVDVIQARIADRLQVSRPAVSEMIRRLETEGLIVTQAAASASPPTGWRSAEQVVRRHRLAERFLTDMLELSWAEAHHEAGKWEHVMSTGGRDGDGPAARQPDHLPARQPDPRLGLRRARLRGRCRDRRSAASFTVSRIPEELEFTPGLLEFLESRARCSRARAASITAASPDGTVTVEIDGATSASARSPAPASWSPREPLRGAAAAALAVVGTARWRAAETTVDHHRHHAPATSDSSSTVPVGTPAELLARLSTETAALSEHVVDDEGEDEALASIEALWAAAARASRTPSPSCSDRSSDAIDLARRAVERRRPADADKAPSNLRTSSIDCALRRR